MSQGLQLNMLLGSPDIALKADGATAEAETQQQGLVFGEMLGDIVQPGKKASGTLRQFPAGISALSEVSQALLIASEASSADDASADIPLAESILGQIALKAAKHDGKTKADVETPEVGLEASVVPQPDHTAGDEALKNELLAQLNSEAATESSATEPDSELANETAQVAVAKGEVQPDSQIAKLPQQSDIAVTVVETISDDGKAAVSSAAVLATTTQAVNADSKATPASATATTTHKGQTAVVDNAAESKAQLLEIAVDPAASNEITAPVAPAAVSDAESAQAVKKAQVTQGGPSSINATVATTAENGIALNSAELSDADKAITVTKTEQTPAISKDIKNSANGQSQAQQSIKITAEQPATNSQQQSNGQQQNPGQQFTAMLEPQNTPDSQTMSKAGPEVLTAAKLEPSFVQQLHTAEQRQNSGVSKVAAKSATEQLKQSLNLQQHDAASQLRQRVSLMVRQNIQVAEVRLDPAGLGQMQIKIDMQQDQAQVQFVVQQPQAKELLEQQLPRLRELLQQQGIVLTEGNVQQQSQHERQLAERDSQRSQSNSQGDDIGAEPDMPEINVQISAKVNDRLVDYYA